MAKAISKLWAQEIIEGNRDFTECPRRLKEEVKELLMEAGREDLIVE